MDISTSLLALTSTHINATYNRNVFNDLDYVPNEHNEHNPEQGPYQGPEQDPYQGPYQGPEQGQDQKQISINTLDITKTITLKNPYLSNGDFKRDIKIKEIIDTHKRIFIITLVDNSIDIGDILYKKYLTHDEYELIRNKLIIKQVSFSIIKNNQIKDLLIKISTNCLPSIFINKDNIAEKLINANEVLVISAVNISNSAVTSYLKLYDGIVSLSNLLQLYLLNDYFGGTYSEQVKKNRCNMINNISETMYWQLKYNCKLNITLHFYNRGFNLSLSQRLEDKSVKEILNRLNMSIEDTDDYLANILKKRNYVDASSNIKYKEFQLYKISNNCFANGGISKEEFNDILHSTISRRELYLLICNILITKYYCHLVINNPLALAILNENENQLENRSLLQKYTPIISYLMSYAWLSLYLEESIKRTYITEHDRFVFTIDTACNLPYFPCLPSNPQTSPYISLLVSKEILCANENNLGVSNYYKAGYPMGICNRMIFNERMNIFISGQNNINYLSNIDWSSIALCGSIIAACLPNFNPLMLNFMRNNVVNMKPYFDEYYKHSDIDVMCNNQCCFEYINVVYNFANKMNENIKLHHNLNDANYYVNVTPIKTAAIMVNQEFIKRYILPNTKMTYVEMVLNIHDTAVKKLFYEWYLKQKLSDNEKYKHLPQFKECVYDPYFDICEVKDLLIVISDCSLPLSAKLNSFDVKLKPQCNKYEKENDVINEIKQTFDEIEINNEDVNEQIDNNIFIKDQDQSQYDDDENKCLLVINENLKFKVESKYFERNFEIFKIKSTFFATVSRFHLPIVRAYITDTNVFILPSCITACMTMMNIDYEYFAGAKDPIEIINKYRSRGYGTYLNQKEKMRMIEYSNLVSKWKQLYALNANNHNSINSFFGNIAISANFYKPSKILYEAQTEYTAGDAGGICITDHNINEVYHLIYGGKYERLTGTQHMIYLKTCINELGFVVPVRKWLIEGCYEQPIPQ